MSSGNERPKFVIWVPDLASETGWSGVRVFDEDRQQRKPDRPVGFQMRKRDERPR